MTRKASRQAPEQRVRLAKEVHEGGLGLAETRGERLICGLLKLSVKAGEAVIDEAGKAGGGANTHSCILPNVHL